MAPTQFHSKNMRKHIQHVLLSAALLIFLHTTSIMSRGYCVHMCEYMNASLPGRRGGDFGVSNSGSHSESWWS